MIIATAGHVDHGKTELIKALTGTDTDRLPEEKARGLSIDLGFAYQALPGNKTLGFVDVPGHEKFIRNMLAGVGGIDVGLLVVAADDGVMPQTREHFAILDLLGIDQCVAAITKIDRVDDHRVLEVQDQVKTLFGNAGREGIDVFPLCAPDNRGIDALKQTLAERAQALRSRPLDGHFRMAIDRVFSLKGVGLVVTGMVLSGSAAIDDHLLLTCDGAPIRVRGIRAHHEVSDRAWAGERCAINIAGRGISEASVSRGDWLMHPDLYLPTTRFDVELRVLESESRPLKHWTPVHLHIGAQHLAARVAILGAGAIAAGERGLVQLVVKQDAFIVHGDRFVLRDQSARRTLAGGYVIDPFSPKRGRARPNRITTLEAMRHTEPLDALAALSDISESGVALETFRAARNISPAGIEAIIESLSLIRVGHPPRERLFSDTQWQRLLNRIETAIGKFHRAQPDRPGASPRDIQLSIKPHVETPVLAQAIHSLVNDRRLAGQGNRFHLPAHVTQVSDRDRQLWAQAASSLAPDTGSPLSLHQVADTMGIDRKTVEASFKNAAKLGAMVAVTNNRYLPTSYAARLAFAAETLAERSAEGQFTVPEYCEQTCIGRNFAIDLLEYFDRLGFTVRSGNSRRVRRSATTVFAARNEYL